MLHYSLSEVYLRHSVGQNVSHSDAFMSDLPLYSDSQFTSNFYPRFQSHAPLLVTSHI